MLTEPNYRDSIWARQTLAGLNLEAGRRKYRVRLLDGQRYQETDYDSLFASSPRMVVVIGTSIAWMPDTLRFFTEKQIDVVLISCDPVGGFPLRGVVRMDYIDTLEAVLSYLQGCGRNRVALYGVNSNSSADGIKHRWFRVLKDREAEGTVFFNDGVLDDCAREFLASARRFDAVICVNDMVAVDLLRALKTAGIRVPEDLFLVSFGDSALTRLVSPTITSASLDHEETGRQAATLYAYLCRQNVPARVSVLVRSALTVRESTAGMPIPPRFAFPALRQEEDVRDFNFYENRDIARLCAAESMASACDPTDLALLRSLLFSDGAKEEALFLTPSALQYRKKRLKQLAGCATMEEFHDFLRFCRRMGLLFGAPTTNEKR